ncbi:MAG: hypothetical protein ACLQVJ_21760 [Syntrophobacteraceae bacterium]
MNYPTIKTSNDYSPIPGVEPELVTLHIPGKSDLIVANPPYAYPSFFQFQSGCTEVRGLLDFGNISPDVLGSWTATGRGDEKKETE